MKQALQNHFREFSLSERQLQRLNEIQKDVFRSPPFLISKKGRRLFAQISLIAVLIVGVFLGWRLFHRTTDISILATEIAYHHNKQMGLEIESPSLENVRAYLSKLDFPLIESKRFPPGEWELLGGRYCSLKGHLAAQLRMRNKKTNKTCTYYQLMMPKGVSEFQGTFEVFEHGAKVTLWQERGLLLGTAEDN